MTHTPTTKYAVICQSVVGNTERGFIIAYGFDGELFDSRKKAIKHGWKTRDSDDFNVAVVDGERVVSLDWMEESDRPQDEDEIREVQEAIFGLASLSSGDA